MKNLHKKLLTVLGILTIALTLGSCSKSNNIVDPTKDNNDSEQNSMLDNSTTHDLVYDANHNNNTGN